MSGGVGLLFDEEVNRRIREVLIPEILEKRRLAFELPLTCRNGGIRILSITAFVVALEGHAIGAIAQDVSEQKQMETQLQLAYDLLNSAPQYISCIDTNGAYKFMNPATHVITGYSYDELTKGGVGILYDEESKKGFRTRSSPE